MIDVTCNTTLLKPHLLELFNSVFTLRTYYDPWREFTTVVLCKPGKPDYTITKAYRPIALINTTCKLLTAIIADQITYMLEHHQLLPDTHFGGRPGRSTTDSLHLLETTIKNAWRTGKVASVLYLDIEGAFPNAVTDRLLHNMRMRRLPSALVEFTEHVLTGRKTQLRFDDHTSDWIPVNNGIGQGDPLSMILYIIYDADLIDIAKGRKGESTLAFVDDTAFIAIGNSFEETHRILKDMLERTDGGFDWSQAHNSRFETSKFALMDFSMNRACNRPPMTIRGIVITPTPTHRFLGVIVDHELRWKEHIDYAIVKGTSYVLQLRRLSSTSTGLPMRLIRQLYQAVAIPKMLYTADVWFLPAFREGSDIAQRGSIGIAKRMSTVQRMAAIAITGAMRTTATDILEAHANLLPIPLLLQNTCHRAIIRLATHPDTHPLHKHIRRAAKRYVKRHRTALHRLTYSFNINPEDIEMLIPARRSPATSCPYKVKIAASREDAIQEQAELQDEIQIFCDGSGLNGKIGAAAVLM